MVQFSAFNVYCTVIYYNSYGRLYCKVSLPFALLGTQSGHPCDAPPPPLFGIPCAGGRWKTPLSLSRSLALETCICFTRNPLHVRKHSSHLHNQQDLHDKLSRIGWLQKLMTSAPSACKPRSAEHSCPWDSCYIRLCTCAIFLYSR